MRRPRIRIPHDRANKNSHGNLDVCPVASQTVEKNALTTAPAGADAAKAHYHDKRHSQVYKIEVRGNR